MSAPLTAVDLFAGAGGLALGTERAGFRHALLAEWDHDACETLRLNPEHPEWRDVVVEGDVRDVDFTAYRGVDLIAGGPPCQSFSMAGRRKLGKAALNMFPAAVQAIADARPRAVLLENVTGLVKGDARAYFDRVLAQIEGLGYRVRWDVLNAADHGVPQLRERVITVAFRNDVDARWEWPAPTWPRRTIREALAGLPPQEWPDPSVLEQDHRQAFATVQDRDADAPARTISTLWAGALVREPGRRVRVLSIPEIARLQTFPDGWPFAGTPDSQLRQLGNAVPVNLARALAGAVARALGRAPRL